MGEPPSPIDGVAYRESDSPMLWLRNATCLITPLALALAACSPANVATRGPADATGVCFRRLEWRDGVGMK